MSWEVINTKKIKCLCGKGFIKQDIMGDDWNRFEEKTPIIDCVECSKKYNIESNTFTPKPHHEYTVYSCIDKKTKEKIKIDL